MIKDNNNSSSQVQFAKCLSALYRLFTESNGSQNTSHDNSRCNNCNVTSEEYRTSISERWVYCWRVWRKLINNDVILLALLFHSGSVWSPDYQQLHAKKLLREQVLQEEEEQQKQNNEIVNIKMYRNATSASSSNHKEVKEEREFVQSTSSIAESRTSNNAVDKIIKDEEEESKILQTRQPETSKLNAHLRRYLQCMQEQSLSMWALNVLHFLRLVEVYEVSDNNNHEVSTSTSKDGEVHGLNISTTESNTVDNEDNISILSSTQASSSTSSSSSSVCSFEEIEKRADNVIVKQKRRYIKRVKREEQTNEQEQKVREEIKLKSRILKVSNNKPVRKRKRLLLGQPNNQNNSDRRTEQQEIENPTEEKLTKAATNGERSEKKHKMHSTSNENNEQRVQWGTSMLHTLQLDDLLMCSSFNPMKLTYQQYLEQQTVQLKEVLCSFGDVSSQINVLKGIVTCTFRDEVMVQTVASALVDEWFDFFSAKKNEKESCNVTLLNRNATSVNVKQTNAIRDYFYSSAIKFAALAQSICSESILLHNSNRCTHSFDNVHLLHLHHIMLRQQFTLDKPHVHDVFCRAIPSIFTVYLLEEFHQLQEHEQQQEQLLERSLFSSLQMLSLPFHYCFAPHVLLNIIRTCRMQNQTRYKSINSNVKCMSESAENQEWDDLKCVTSSSMLLAQSSAHVHEFTLALQSTREKKNNENIVETIDDKSTVVKMRNGKTPMIAPFSYTTTKKRGRPHANKETQSAKEFTNTHKEHYVTNQDDNNNRKGSCNLYVSDVFVAEFINITERTLFMREITRYNEKNDDLENQSSHTDHSTSINFVSDRDFTHFGNSNGNKGRNWRRSRRDKYKRRRFGGLFDTDETDFTFVNLSSPLDESNNGLNIKMLSKESRMHEKLALIESTAHVEVISVEEAITALLFTNTITTTTTLTTTTTKQQSASEKMYLFYSPSLPSSQLGCSSPHETQSIIPNGKSVCNGTFTSKSNVKGDDSNYSNNLKRSNIYPYTSHALSAVNATVMFLYTTAKRIIAIHVSKSSNYNLHEHNLDHSEASSNTSDNNDNSSMLVLGVQCALHALLLLTCLDPVVYKCDNTLTTTMPVTTTTASTQGTDITEEYNKLQMEWLQRKVEIASFIVEVCVSSALPSNKLLQIGFMMLLMLWHSSCANMPIVHGKLSNTIIRTIGDIESNKDNSESVNEYTLQCQLTLIAIKLFATLSQREVECVNFSSHTANINNKIKNEVYVNNTDNTERSNSIVIEEKLVDRLPAPWWSSFRSAVIKNEKLYCYIPTAWSSYILRVEQIVKIAMQELMFARRHVVHQTEQENLLQHGNEDNAFRSNNNYGKKPHQIKNKCKREKEHLEEEEFEEEQLQVQKERSSAQNGKNKDEEFDERYVNEEEVSQIILSDAQPCYYGSSVVCSSVPLVHIVEETEILSIEEDELQQTIQKGNINAKSNIYTTHVKSNNLNSSDDNNDDVELLPYLPPHLREDNKPKVKNNNNINSTTKTKSKQSSNKLNKAASMLWLSLEGVVNCNSLHTSSIVSTPRWSESDE